MDEIYIAVVDNSGSNRRIAEAIREAAGHIHGAIGAMAPKAAIAFQFFSDHRDGDRLFQYADYTTAGTRGESVLRASVANIANANGFDEAEAIECALHQVAQLNFGHIPKEKRHLILVTDVVGHGMGMIDDDGCPHQVSWRRSLEEVALQFGSFRVVATGNNSHVLELQAKFVPSDRRRFDLLDMVTGGLSPEERARLVPNAVLFLEEVRPFISIHNQRTFVFDGGFQNSHQTITVLYKKISGEAHETRAIAFCSVLSWAEHRISGRSH